MSLLCVLCAGAMGSGLVWFERVNAVQGSGARLHVALLSAGWVDRRGDNRGTVVGLWWLQRDNDPAVTGFNEVPIFEIDAGSFQLAGK